MVSYTQVARCSLLLLGFLLTLQVCDHSLMFGLEFLQALGFLLLLCQVGGGLRDPLLQQLLLLCSQHETISLVYYLQNKFPLCLIYTAIVSNSSILTFISLLLWSSNTITSSSIFFIFASMVTFSSWSFCLAASSSSSCCSKSCVQINDKLEV